MVIKALLKKTIGINNIEIIKSWFPSAKERVLLEKRRIFYSQFLKKDSLFFDVGANYGNRIEPLINEGIRIITIEPQIECVRYLKNKYREKISVVQKGLGSKVETKLMYVSPHTNILSSFSKEWIDSTIESGRFQKIKWNEEREIQMTTLDRLIESYGSPDFIKIDVEGFELEVLKGLSSPVKVLSIEYTVPERKDTLIDCLLYLNGLSNSAVKFNYCIGENTEFSLSNWVSFDKITEVVNSKGFLSTQIGDVYAMF